MAHDEEHKYPQRKSKGEIALWERRTLSVPDTPETRVEEAKRIG